MLRKLSQLLAVIAILLVSNRAISQVTTSTITGVVKDPKGQLLEGATIRAEHLPSGSQYSTFSTKGGSFTLPGLRTGGPYKVEITYTGFAPAVFEGIILQLGEPFNLAAGLKETESVLENVVVTSTKRKGAVDKTGASTNINNRQITTLPTISRSITDFTRLTPQAQGSSFAGRDGRYNNLQIDGANLNNNFGLSTDALPGGGNQPISLDAIEEVSVNIAPYDVRQSGFTGAGINAITKSGTNKFKGSVYGYFRDQDMNGTNVAGVKLPPLQTSENQIFGATIGGAIVKNKLFFFLSAESEERSFPGVTLVPSGIGVTGPNVSNTHIDSLNKLANFVKTKYGYDAGGATDFPNFAVKNRKLLARIDWNINKSHKLTLKYSDLLVSQDDAQLNGSSVPNNPTFRPAGSSGSISRLPNNRFSNNSFAFANSNYGTERIVKSGSFELNSNFKGKFSNQLLATVTKIQDTRIYKGGLFPTVDIFNNNGQNYMQIGIDPFTYNNDVINDVYNVVDNLTYYAGKHTITGGISYEYQRVGNMFMPGAASYYGFNSMDDFINNRAPAVFSLTYAYNNKENVYAADLKIGQLGFYVQDEFNVNDRFKLTYGVRFDKPIYLEEPAENPAFSALTFADRNGQPAKYSTGIWPEAKILASPRVGFRWDVEGDKRMVVRGGMGIFTGRIPFVWLTNIPSNSQMLQNSVAVTDPTRLRNYLFNPNPLAYRDSFPSSGGTGIANNPNFVVADPNFKFPQVWRTNIAVDQNLGNGFLLTLEALYSKDINAVVMRNANEKPTNGTLSNGNDKRPRFIATADRRINSAVGTAVVLENTNKGQQFTGTAQLSKSFANGFYGSLAYTYFYADDVTANPGSQASSVWNSNPTTGTQNLIQGAASSFAVPHRIVATVSYRKEYFKHFATTVSLFYQGSAQSRYTYVYNGDLNNDGNNTTDLMYIADPSTVAFVNIPVSNTNPTVKWTAAQQTAAWTQFVENTKYLSNRTSGQYAERNGALLPWFNQLDFKFLQDIFTDIGKSKNTIQFSLDILNFANMLNNDWGIRKAVTFSNPLRVNSVNASTGIPNFQLQELNGQLVTKPTQNVISTSSTWGMQIGLRYIFN